MSELTIDYAPVICFVLAYGLLILFALVYCISGIIRECIRIRREDKVEKEKQAKEVE